MAHTALSSLDDLPEYLRVSEVAAATRQGRNTVRRKLRSGEIPGTKLPGGSEWRIRREVVQRILAAGGNDQSPAEQRAELLGDATVQHLRELAARAPELTAEQRDLIRAAFKAGVQT
ncbi:helix-turn-helix domain-containing protein [Mycobacterium asiaticum]|uniref:Helix-turn-helix domain-containing protein n=1 Tax=Mycobacterium asiaticum TaxID=1790 RepID=A0A1A3KRC2_MYCAS|nr:helix-turn-helix domain-containing protein [Mycobacterium asiaticum]OBJ86501.1 hypothetical protein A5640_11085 [Mycobacterium asiaticum]